MGANIAVSDNPLCRRLQLFSQSRSIVPLAERPFGEDDGIAFDRIHRGDCNRLFHVPANLNQSTTNVAKGVKNGKN